MESKNRKRLLELMGVEPTPQALKVLKLIPNSALAIPLIKEDMDKLSYNQMAIKYGLTKKEVRLRVKNLRFGE